MAFLKKGQIVGIATISLVLIAAVAYFFIPELQQAPPTLIVASNKFQGLISRDVVCRLPGTYEFSEDEIDDFEEPAGTEYDLMAGVHFYHANQDLTVSKILDSIEPSEDNKILFAFYSHGETGKTEGFHLYPGVGGSGNKTIQNPDNFTIPKNRGFILMACEDSRIWDVKSENMTGADLPAAALTMEDGWILVPAPNKFADKLKTVTGKIKAVWIQNGPGLDFEKSDQLDPIDLNEDYYMAWINFDSSLVEPVNITASCEITPLTGTAQDTIFTLKDKSTGDLDKVAEIEWFFGYGNNEKRNYNSNNQNANNESFLYLDPGTYTPKIILHDSEGDTHEAACGTVTVNAPVVAELNAACTISANTGFADLGGGGTTFTLTNQSTGVIANLTWDLGNGTLIPENYVPNNLTKQVKFPEKGTYTVKLTVNDLTGGTKTATCGNVALTYNPETVLSYSANSALECTTGFTYKKQVDNTYICQTCYGTEGDWFYLSSSPNYGANCQVNSGGKYGNDPSVDGFNVFCYVPNTCSTFTLKGSSLCTGGSRKIEVWTPDVFHKTDYCYKWLYN